MPLSLQWVLALFAAAGLIEQALQVAWHPTYWRLGPTLFQRVRRADAAGRGALSGELLERQGRRSPSPFSSLIFRQLPDGRIAFRERMWGEWRLTYPPVMRGLIEVDPRAGTVTVRGLLNGFPIAALLTFALLFASLRLPIWPYLGFVAAFFALAYGVQSARFAHVATLAEALWSGKPIAD